MTTISQEPTSPTVERRRRESRVLGREMWAVPSVVVVALFASPATWAIAKYGFGRRGNDRG